MTAKQDQLKLIQDTIDNATKLGNKRDVYTLGSLYRHRQKRKLTYRQEDFLKKLIERNDEKAIQEKAAQGAEWIKEWSGNPQLQEKAEVCAKYYLAVGYYTSTAQGVLSFLKGDTEVLPPRHSIMKMVENNYADQVWESYTSEPRWKRGEIVAIRSSFKGNLPPLNGIATGHYMARSTGWPLLYDLHYLIVEVNSKSIDKS